MKLMTYCDIEAPIDYAFDSLSQFDGAFAIAQSKGAHISPDHTRDVQIGNSWDVSFQYRKKRRKAHIELTAFSGPTLIAGSTQIGDFVTDSRIELVQLSRQKTRVMVKIDVSAHSLTAKFMLQSFKLAKSRIRLKFEQRVSVLLKGIEARYRSGDAPSIVSMN